MLVAKRDRKKTIGPMERLARKKSSVFSLPRLEGDAADEGDDRQINQNDNDRNHLAGGSVSSFSRCLGQARLHQHRHQHGAHNGISRMIGQADGKKPENQRVALRQFQ